MNVKERIIYTKLDSLSKSKFRSKFKLTDEDKAYIKNNGIDKIIKHAYNFINERLASEIILNDGKQTPMSGHPVFIAQHATGTCCRCCLLKWHGIDKNKQLSDKEINYVVSIIISWIIRKMKK